MPPDCFQTGNSLEGGSLQHGLASESRILKFNGFKGRVPTDITVIKAEPERADKCLSTTVNASTSSNHS